MLVGYLSWAFFVAHGLLGNLLVFVGGGLVTLAFLGAILVKPLYAALM